MPPAFETDPASASDDDAQTERRRLVESEERVQLALSAGRGIGTWDRDVVNDRVVADERFARLYGVTPERARGGAPIAEFFAGLHPDDVARVQERSNWRWQRGNIGSSTRTAASAGSWPKAAASWRPTARRAAFPA